jgi:hypothetical protein
MIKAAVRLETLATGDAITNPPIIHITNIKIIECRIRLVFFICCLANRCGSAEIPEASLLAGGIDCWIRWL